MEQEFVEQENVVIDDSLPVECMVDSAMNEELTENHNEKSVENQINKTVVLEEAPMIIKNTIKQLIVDRVQEQVETKVVSDENEIKEEYNRYLELRKQKLTDYVFDLQEKIVCDNNAMTTIKLSLQQSDGLIQFLNRQIDNIGKRKIDNKNRLETTKIKMSNQQKQFDSLQQDVDNKRRNIIKNFNELKNAYIKDIDNNQDMLETLKRELEEITQTINNVKEEIEAFNACIAKQLEEKRNMEENLLKTKNGLIESCLQKDKELKTQDEVISSLTNEIDACKEKIQSLRVNIQELHDTDCQYKDGIDALEKNIDNLSREYQENHENVDKIRSEIEKIDEASVSYKNEFDRSFQERENELTALEAELIASQDLQSEQLAEVESLEKTIDEKLKIKDSLLIEVSNYRASLKNHYETVNLLKEEQATKRQILQDLQNKTVELKEKSKNLDEQIINQQNSNDEKTQAINTKLENLIHDNNEIIDQLTNIKKFEVEKSQQFDVALKEKLPILSKHDETIDELTRENNRTKLKIQSKLQDLNQLRSFVKKLSKNRYKLSMSFSRSVAESEISTTKKVHFDETVHIKSGTEESDSQNQSQK